MKNRFFISVVASLMLSNNVVNAKEISLQEAVDSIVKEYKVTYISKSNSLKDKKIDEKKINYKENALNSLNNILESNDLKAIEEDGVIYIIEKPKKTSNSKTTILEEISVNDKYLGSTTENSDSYTTGSTNTATKLDLSLRDTPQTVVVYTRQKLDDQNIKSIDELLSKISGVSMNRVDERLNVSARGFDVDYYLYDGIPTSLIDSNDPDLIVYDRVEIVKGANGLMTGAGNPAMGMNIIRKHANAKEFTGNIDLRAGSWDDYSASLDIQTPLNSDKTIRGRFVAKHQDAKSFLDFYEKTNDIFYGVVDIDLTDITYLSLGVSYENIQRDGTRWGGLPAFYSDGSKTNFSRSKNVGSDWTYWDDRTTTYFVDFKQYFYNDISLNLGYSSRHMNKDMLGTYFSGLVDKETGIGIGDITTGLWKKKDEENNLDLYTSIPFELKKLDHEIITGISYNKSDTKEYDFVTDNVSSSIINPTINFNHINIVNPYLQLNTSPADKIVQKAYYIASRFSLMEYLKLIAGTRVSSWEYESDNGNSNRKFGNEVIPYVGLIYDIDNNHSIYASYTTIFKPQSSRDADDKFLDPINGKNYESGIKGEYLDGHLNTYLSVFRIEQDGVGESTGQINSNGNDISVAKKGVTSKGFEIGASGKITDDFNLDFGLANFEAKDANGEKFTTTNSRTTANVWAKYTIDDYRFGVGLNYKSKFYSGSGTTQITQDAFITTDLMAGYKVNKSLDFQLNVNNLFDETYYEGLSDANNLLYGAPRSFTVGMKYSF
ncbi:TonB-dependent siderophore receptor [Aliarcobacter butzleri]|uniref:TonB-dependent siderophore receptor n=1 Tax=Aliarcobacter butzleri TaxID=28197 RepID=A0AAW7QA35_9BACT|nr:TonB-dependent siderophore receptor [Aliarcobacter butzleri]MDN5106526.1 TonB-dependent siderophore receptor [Aliarcobacter butzleri]MDN5123248.1 TonB-dependent siderophore receptor [Aliarcobacter butzleri]